MSHNSGPIHRLRVWWHRPRWEWRIYVDDEQTFNAFVSRKWARRRVREIREMARSVGVRIRVRVHRVPMEQVHAENNAFAQQIRESDDAA